MQEITYDEYLDALTKVFTANIAGRESVEPKPWDDPVWRAGRIDAFPEAYTAKLRRLIQMLEDQARDLRYENEYLREENARLKSLK